MMCLVIRVLLSFLWVVEALRESIDCRLVSYWFFDLYSFRRSFGCIYQKASGDGDDECWLGDIAERGAELQYKTA
jgi:hypothetical protein